MPTVKASTSSSTASFFRASCKTLPNKARGLLWVAAALLAAVNGAWALSGGSERQGYLTEMRARRIISKEALSWSPEQYTEMLRAREAERLGAFSMLRGKLGTLKGYAVEQRQENGYRDLLLTRAGYQRFIFLLSQEARGYFEKKGAEAKFVFRLKDMSGAKIFDGRGHLTQAGISVYNRIRRNEAVFWRHWDGRLGGTVRPPRDGRVPLRRDLPPEPAKKKEPSPAERIADLTRKGYVELTAAEYQFLLKQTRLSSAKLAEQSTIQLVRSQKKIYYMIAPSDPLMAVVSRRRGARAHPHKH